MSDIRRPETEIDVEINTQDRSKPPPKMQTRDLKKNPVKMKNSKIWELTKKFDFPPNSSNPPY